MRRSGAGKATLGHLSKVTALRKALATQVSNPRFASVGPHAKQDWLLFTLLLFLWTFQGTLIGSQNARREKIKIVDAWIAVILDTVWVVGSYVLWFAVRFSIGGKWAVAVVAELVFLFALVQWLGLRTVGRKGQVA